MKPLAQSVAITAICVVVSVVGCARFVTTFTAERQDWEFIESVGGMQIGKLSPISEQVYYLGLMVDVSGSVAVTQDTGLAIKEIVARRRGHAIEIHLVTCGSASKLPSSASGVHVGYLPHGEYVVRYSNSNGTLVDLGTVVANYPPE